MSKEASKKGFAEMLAELEPRGRSAQGVHRPRVGDVVSGRVVAISSEAVFVELGAKSEGVLDRDQLADKDGQLTVRIGDVVQARVADTSGGTIVLRIKVGRGADSAAELALAYEHRVPIEGTVAAVIKGGVEVTVAGNQRAFCAISQLDARYVENPAEFVGQKLTFRITRYEAGRGKSANIVVSRRVLLEEEATRRMAELRAQLNVDDVLEGTVTALKDYGAFVDLGGIEGMLHISELGFGRVEHPSEVLAVGQKVQVQLIRLEPSEDPKRPDRISLSLKSLQRDPWEEAVERLSEGQRFTGKVVRTEPFGAFVELPGGVQGLVHVSELLTDRRIIHAREVVSVGQEIEVSVISIDREKKRIGLSMKAADAQREAAQAESYDSGKGSLGTFADLLKPKQQPEKKKRR